MKKIFAILAILSIMLVPMLVFAQGTTPTAVDYTKGDPKAALTDLRGKSGYSDKSDNLVGVIGNVIKILLTAVGIIVVVLVVYAGFLWMTAGGNEDQVKKAKQWLINAVIGLALIMAAYAISDFAITNLTTATKA